MSEHAVPSVQIAVDDQPPAVSVDWPEIYRAFGAERKLDAETVEVWLSFWLPLVTDPNTGLLDLAQIMRELYDYRVVMQEVRRVYYHLTNGKFSKPNTAAEYIIAAVEETYSDMSE